MTTPLDIFDDDLFSDEETGGRLLTIMVPADAGGRMDAWLAEQFPEFSRSRIQALIWQKRITCDGAPLKASATPRAGQLVEIAVPPLVPATPQPEDIPLDIVYEDPYCLVVNKPPGLVVHPAAGHLGGTLVNALLHYCRDLKGVGGIERPGIVHRLDKDTSGLIIIAKSDLAMNAFVNLFHEKAISKVYLAVVHGCPDPTEGRIENLIARKPHNRRKMAIVEYNGKTAVTHYRVERPLNAASLLRCRIETGRTHQIRVHMRFLGTPIVGDAAYGRPVLDKALPLFPARQMLHATRLTFTHPVTGQPLDFECPPPGDFNAILASLENAPAADGAMGRKEAPPAGHPPEP